MDSRQIINYVNFAALICYILGRVLNMGILSWIGLGIMTLSYLCGLPGTRRTITLRTLILQL